MLIDHYRSIGDDATADAIEEEFFWYVDTSVSYFRSLGLSVEAIRFSTLSWGIKVQMSGCRFPNRRASVVSLPVE